MDIWDILEILPTKDKRAIKRAYAKMLANYHPEEYPEKFQEVQAAYEWALQYANLELVTDKNEDQASWQLESLAFEYDEDVAFLDNTTIFNEEANLLEARWLEKENEEKKIAALALLTYKTLLEKKLKRKAVRKFIASEQFHKVKQNAYFIEGFMNLSSEYYGCCLQKPKVMLVLEKAFGLDADMIGNTYIYQDLHDWFVNYRNFSYISDDTKRDRREQIKVVTILICLLGVLIIGLYFSAESAETPRSFPPELAPISEAQEQIRLSGARHGIGRYHLVSINLGNLDLSDEETGKMIYNELLRYLWSEYEMVFKLINIQSNANSNIMTITYEAIHDSSIEARVSLMILKND